MSWLIGTILPIILNWFYAKGQQMLALFIKEKEEEAKNTDALKKAEDSDNTDNLFGGSN